MVNPFRETNWNPGAQERRRFAASLMIGFPCLAAALLIVMRLRGTDWHFTPPIILAAAGAALGALLWVTPPIARPVYVAWYAVACAIGFVVGNVALAAIYFLLFTPVGLVLRAMNRRSFRKNFDRAATTYWRDAKPPAEPAHYYRQF
jgi:hypothetical protein